ncbi:MAG: hypothetical protein WCG27_07330 [Pseudomonadota bacterium]
MKSLIFMIVLIFSFTTLAVVDAATATVKPVKKISKKGKMSKDTISKRNSAPSRSGGMFDFTRARDRSYNDLMLLPKSMTFWGETSFEHTSDGYDQADNNGKEFLNVDMPKNMFIQKARFGISESFGVGLDLAYGSLSAELTQPVNNNKTTKMKFSGLADPVFNGKFRLLHQKDMPVELDFIAAISPSFGKAKYPKIAANGDTNGKGTIARGGTNFELGAEVGQRFTNFQWKAGPKLEICGSQKKKSPETTWKFESRTDFTVHGDAQFRFSDLFLLNSHLALIFEGEEVKKQGDANKITTEGGTNLQLSVDGLFNFIPEKLGVGLTLVKTFMGDREVKQADDKSDSINKGSFMWGLFGRYQF